MRYKFLILVLLALQMAALAADQKNITPTTRDKHIFLKIIDYIDVQGGGAGTFISNMNMGYGLEGRIDLNPNWAVASGVGAGAGAAWFPFLVLPISSPNSISGDFYTGKILYYPNVTGQFYGLGYARVTAHYEKVYPTMAPRYSDVWYGVIGFESGNIWFFNGLVELMFPIVVNENGGSKIGFGFSLGIGIL